MVWNGVIINNLFQNIAFQAALITDTHTSVQIFTTSLVANKLLTWSKNISLVGKSNTCKHLRIPQS